VFAAKNPVDSSHMVVVYAGNSPLETARSASLNSAMGESAALALEEGRAN